MTTKRLTAQVAEGAEKILVFLCVLCALRGSWLSLAAQEPTFKGAIRTVAVYATVANAEGRLVPDLGRAAFSVLDNGKRQ